MTNISSFFVIIAVSVAVVGSQAFAQPFEPKAGLDSAPAFSLLTAWQQSDRTASPQHFRSKPAPRHSGSNAFDLVPQGPYDPALNGGGSVGYDENLRIR